VDLKKAKDWTTAAITVSQLLSINPCFVKHICLTANTGGAATALIYDGEGANAELKLALSCLTSTHFEDDFEIPIYFQRGIYVAVGSNTTLFVIQYKEELACDRLI